MSGIDLRNGRLFNRRKHVSLFLENANEQMEALGIPLIGECYVVEHGEISAQQLYQKVVRLSRVMTERFHKVVENLPVPAFTISAEKLDTELEVLQKAETSVAAGAQGIIFGGNIFMARNPAALIDALDRVMNRQTSHAEALKACGLA